MKILEILSKCLRKHAEELCEMWLRQKKKPIITYLPWQDEFATIFDCLPPSSESVFAFTMVSKNTMQ